MAPRHYTNNLYYADNSAHTSQTHDECMLKLIILLQETVGADSVALQLQLLLTRVALIRPPPSSPPVCQEAVH